MGNLQYATELPTEESIEGSETKLNIFLNKEGFRVVDPETEEEEIKFSYTMDTFEKSEKDEMRTITKACADEILNTAMYSSAPFGSENVNNIIDRYNKNNNI